MNNTFAYYLGYYSFMICFFIAIITIPCFIIAKIIKKIRKPQNKTIIERNPVHQNIYAPKEQSPPSAQPISLEIPHVESGIEKIRLDYVSNTHKRIGADYLSFIDNFTGEEFENFCVVMLESNGFREVSVTPKTGDHGVDIIAWRAKRKFAIQCKCYKDHVGNKAIQEVYTGRKLYNCGEAIVMTNNYFSRQAIQEAKELNVMLYDRTKIAEYLNGYLALLEEEKRLKNRRQP